jgi:predicted DNA-binding transcriptional regulator AlpA
LRNKLLEGVSRPALGLPESSPAPGAPEPAIGLPEPTPAPDLPEPIPPPGPEPPGKPPPARGPPERADRTQRRVFRTPAAAQYLGLTASTLEKMRLTGSGPQFVRLGTRAVGYTVDDLDAFIEAGRRASTSDPGPNPAPRNRARKSDTHQADSSP